MKYYIRDKDWAIIYTNLIQEQGLHTGKEEQVRMFFETTWYMYRSGCQWRLLPSYYGIAIGAPSIVGFLGPKGHLGTATGKSKNQP